MPTPKYVCDYCNKQFHDSPASRKRHMHGVLHQRAVKAWYDQFRGTEQDGNRRTGVCTYFQRTGTCHFGSDCYYLHVTPPNPYGSAGMSDPNVANTTAGPFPADVTQGSGQPAPPLLPVNRLAESKLPPSLQPPPEEGYTILPFIDWGW